ncbi:MAG: hypothetical protein ACRC1M_01065 [Methanobacteriaceae archaeon]
MNKQYIGIIIAIIVIVSSIGGIYYFTAVNNTNMESNSSNTSANTNGSNITNDTNNTKNTSNNYIGESKAISIMKSSSPDGAPGASAVLTTFNGKPMYKVSWENGNYAYVDAVSGTVYDKYGKTGGYA